VQVIMDNKPTKREMRGMSRDVTEPLPGMLDPISQAYKDKMDAKKAMPTPQPPMPKKPKGMRAGGYVKAADGCCKRGKTRGRMV